MTRYSYLYFQREGPLLVALLSDADGRPLEIRMSICGKGVLLVFWCALAIAGLLNLLVLAPKRGVKTSLEPHSKAKPIVYWKMFVTNGRPVEPPTRNFVFIKTHKTGGSSIRDMLKKAIETYNLTEVVPKSRSYGFGPNFDPAKYDHRHKPGDYNAVIEHSRFAPSVTNRLIRNPVYFTVLRNPETLFLSAFDFFPGVRECVGGVDVSLLDVLDNPSEYYPKLQKCEEHYLILNSMAYEMGMNPPYSDDDVRAKIREMDETFLLVMIMEYIEESLVMLRRLFNWRLSDVVSLPTNTHPDFKGGDENASDYEKLIAHHEATVLTENHKKVLRQWLHADFLLYEHFLKVFEVKIREEEEQTGNLLWEVEEYKKEMVALCKGKGFKDINSMKSQLKFHRPQMVNWYMSKTN